MLNIFILILRMKVVPIGFKPLRWQPIVYPIARTGAA